MENNKPWESYQAKPWESYSKPEAEPEVQIPLKYEKIDTEPEATVFTPYAEIRKDIGHKELYEDKSWLAASREMYKLQNQTDAPADMTNQELAEWGMDEISGFNWNITSMAFDTARITSAPQEVKEAFLYALDQYDAVENSWKTTGLAAKNLLQDPSTYVGLATFGFAGASAQGAKIVGKEALKLTLREAIKAGANALELPLL